MDSHQIKKVVIAGGGTAGWLAAVALSKQLGEILDITLVESEEIGTVGVGEATIPPMRAFHGFMRIDEQEFMRATSATFKLGIQFENWGDVGEQYIHSFGKNGKESWLAEFHNFWLRGVEMGIASEIGDYCFELQAAKAGKFATGPGAEINYAYHLDATKYAKFLRKICEKHGTKRVEGKIKKVVQNGDTGFIEALRLETGEMVEGDFFIDCTGFRGLLIEQTLQTGFEDWSQWLMCNAAAVVQTKSTGPAMPITRSIAHEAGWRWRIPLQHRIGNGLVFNSDHMSEDEAVARLLREVDGETVNEPRVLKFRTGKRKKIWNKNCLALGLASGFLEPLESTSIHLVIIGITRFMQLFPHTGCDQALEDQYNSVAIDELQKIRDFLILHYHVTRRDDSDFWRYCRSMAIPDSLTHRIELFKENAFAYQGDGELFRVDSWTQVMLGQGIRPRHYHPVVKTMSEVGLKQLLGGIQGAISGAVERMPEHQLFVDHYCKSSMS